MKKNNLVKQDKKDSTKSPCATVTCEINGQKLKVLKGRSIIEAFKDSGQDIAHYCWHPGLSVAGVCRLCLVDIEGMPKLQIACNTKVQEGMKISNQSEKVKTALRWGLEFHLINHPLDCPICDQAGECELQEQYMRFGKYTPKMAERKVKKRKVIDLGSKIVLDSERCILCSRCVRFTDEVSKTGELGIFNRGDNSEIGVFKDKALDNDYALNTVDICPVGALTSKNFRFRQRVWYLKTKDSICPGCSTGCSVTVDYNEEGLFRIKPRYNQEVNKHWMCDKGRKLYALSNPKGRLSHLKAPKGVLKPTLPTTNGGTGTKSLPALSHTAKGPSDRTALVLTGQYSTEEYQDFVSFFIDCVGKKENIYHWKNNPDSFNDFDGLLLRGDKNPNTRGLLQVLKEKQALNPWDRLQARLKQGDIKMALVAGPENQGVFPDLTEKIKLFESYCEQVVWWTARPLPVPSLEKTWQVPAKTFFEKDGSFINFKGLEQSTKAIEVLVKEALSLSESALLLRGKSLPAPAFLKTASAGPTASAEPTTPAGNKQPLKFNHFTLKKGHL